ARHKSFPENSIYYLSVTKLLPFYFIVIRSDFSINELVSPYIQEQTFRNLDLIYNFIDTTEGSFFTAALKAEEITAEAFIRELQKVLNRWQQAKIEQKIMR